MSCQLMCQRHFTVNCSPSAATTSALLSLSDPLTAGDPCIQPLFPLLILLASPCRRRWTDHSRRFSLAADPRSPRSRTGEAAAGWVSGDEGPEDDHIRRFTTDGHSGSFRQPSRAASPQSLGQAPFPPPGVVASSLQARGEAGGQGPAQDAARARIDEKRRSSTVQGLHLQVVEIIASLAGQLKQRRPSAPPRHAPPTPPPLSPGAHG